MTKKIFRSIFLTALAVLLVAFAVITAALYSHFADVQKQALRREVSLAAAAVQTQGQSYLETLADAEERFTWIAADGTVLYDTAGESAKAENHADRAEFIDARKNGTGESTRYSSTLLQKTMYSAIRLADGSILRIAVSRATVGLLLIGMLPAFLLVLLAALILSAVLASGLAKRIVEPLNHLDLEHPLENDAYEEIAPLLSRINRQRLALTEQQTLFRRKTQEFEQITASMSEGLVLLDEKGAVLSINPAAQRIFGADDTVLGKDFLTLDHTHAVIRALDDAKQTGHGEVRQSLGGREYQFDVSAIVVDGHPMGGVLLAFDVSATALAEQQRREFTANVSHELKTPLQGIIGSAELLESGMVKEQDRARFLGHIRSEASRLLTLIEDIIRLSQLDEGGELPSSTVELYALADETVQSLADEAKRRGVTLTLSGSPVTVRGVPSLLSEVIYNLCDNAIKYNCPDGTVHIEIGTADGMAKIVVSDTGIGIPPQHQDRVFERFYRVDKSHSKASGGTGLGLSIVKHATLLHHGKIFMQSEEGKGTTMTVLLPLA